MSYDLNQLGSDKFERLCQTLLKAIIGNGTTTFGAGKDAAREATFIGKAPYPSKTEQWDGHWIFQVKFHDTSLLGSKEARQEVINELEVELNKIVNKYKHKCDNFILITNVRFSSTYQKGTHDKIEDKKRLFSPHKVKNIHVWAGDELDCFIKKYPEIRKAFPELLTFGDKLNAPENNLDISIEALANFPDIPNDEILRDQVVRSIASKFSKECKIQVLVGASQTGKTILLSQFVRQHESTTIRYFITADPLSQGQHPFLFSLCVQISKILSKTIPSQELPLANLKTLFTQLCYELSRQKTNYYLVIDGFEWALKGMEDTRIVDLFPIQRSPHLIISCSLEKFDMLPTHLNGYTVDSNLWAFDRSNTREYFKDMTLSPEEIDKIHSKYNGIPGYLKIVKNNRVNNPNFNIDTLPNELNQLIHQQIDIVFNIATDFFICRALEFMAISPVPLFIDLLASLLETDSSILRSSFDKIYIVRYISGGEKVGYVNELTQENIKNRLDKQSQKERKEQLLHCAEVQFSQETLLLDLLQKELNDYSGFQKRLTPQEVIQTINMPSAGISSVIKRLQSAIEMAKQNEDISGLVKWVLFTNVAKSFTIHATNEGEITALIAIGEFQKALSIAFSIPEITSMIRLVAQTYTHLKSKGEIIPNDALESLKASIENLVIEELDKDIAQEIAIDLFPILPDQAFSILGKVIGFSDKKSVIETAIEQVSINLQGQTSEELSLTIKNKRDASYVEFIISRWLTNLDFARLEKEIEPIENNKAKDYLIRQWCKQNLQNNDLVKAIKKWLDLMIGIREAIPLRSLRHMTELVIKLPIEDRKYLIEDLRIPELISLDSPKEEWVRVRLNLAEALFEIDPQKSQLEIEDVYENVIQTVIEIDIKVFCLARLLITVNRTIPNQILKNELEQEFQKSFDFLRNNSADQFELTKDIIRSFVEIDPEESLIIAMHLNTVRRRNAAVQLVLLSTLRKYGNQDRVGIIRDSLNYLGDHDNYFRDITLVKIIGELNARNCDLLESNLDILLVFLKEIKDPTFKSEALANLAILYNKKSPSKAFELLEDSIGSWRNENDLNAKLAWGYRLVEYLSKIDMNQARTFCKEVQELAKQPKTTLIKSNLGIVYQEVLELAIRSMDNKVFTDSDPNGVIFEIERKIEQIPVAVDKICLYAKLIASAYHNDCSKYADKKAKKIIQDIENLPEGTDKDNTIQFCFPVIYQYDDAKAKELLHGLTKARQNLCWHSTALWFLCYSHLGDHYINSEDITISCSFSKLNKITTEIITNIETDEALYDSIRAVSHSIKVSFREDSIEQGQALKILLQLDNLATQKLPDKQNIQHNGYLILSKAVIHDVRSFIFFHLEKAQFKSPRGLTDQDIRQSWKDICEKMRLIPNVADQVLVSAKTVALMSDHYKKDKKAYPKHVLKESEQQIRNIPTLLDRISRLEVIGEAWHNLGEMTQIEYIVQQMITSIESLSGTNVDKSLKTLTQTIYKIGGADLADKFISQLDTNRSPQLSDSANMFFLSEKLIQNPAKLTQIQASKIVLEDVLNTSSQKLIANLVSGKDVANSKSLQSLQDWLSESIQFTPEVSFNVIHWVVENLHRRSGKKYVDIKLFLDTANLIYLFAEKIAPLSQEGIPISIRDSFPLLNQNVIEFNESSTARKWLERWLGENVIDNLKICDPDFGENEIDYLKYIPSNCKVMIITTSKYLDDTDNGSNLKKELKLYWGRITNQQLPFTTFLIVPEKFRDKFNQRIVLSTNVGLNLTQSLRELGKNHSRIISLTGTAIQEIEETYWNNMFNSSTWIMEHDVSPIIVSIR